MTVFFACKYTGNSPFVSTKSILSSSVDLDSEREVFIPSKPNSLNSPFMNRNPQTINVTNIPRITERKTVLPYHTQTKRKSNYNSEGLYQMRNGTQHPNDEYFNYLNDNLYNLNDMSVSLV